MAVVRGLVVGIIVNAVEKPAAEHPEISSTN